MPSIKTQLLTNLPRVTSPNGKLVGVEGEKIFRRLQWSIAYSTWRKCLTQKVGLKEVEDFFWRHERRSGRSEKCFYLTKDALRRIPEDLLMRRSDKQEAKRGKRKTKEAPREVSPAEFLESLLPGYSRMDLSVAVRQDNSVWGVNGEILHALLGLESGYYGWTRNQRQSVEGGIFLARAKGQGQ